MLPLYNRRKSIVRIAKGERVAQLIIRPLPEVEIEVVEQLGETERCAGGFGSSGRF